MLEVRNGWTTPIGWKVEPEALGKLPLTQVLKILLQHARADSARLYTVIDCARDDEALRLLAFEEQPWRSLFQGGSLEPSLSSAPVLAQVKGLTRLMRWLTEEVWGRQQAIYILSRLDLESLAAHLTSYIRVHDRWGITALFRFYDPRVLRTYLLSSSPPELEDFFAGSTRLLCESEVGDVLVFDRAGYEPATLRELNPGSESKHSSFVSEAVMDAFEQFGMRLFHESTIRMLRP